MGKMMENILLKSFSSLTSNETFLAFLFSPPNHPFPMQAHGVISYGQELRAMLKYVATISTCKHLE